MTMDMDRFTETCNSVASGQFTNVDRAVISEEGLYIRVRGDFVERWEHFVEVAPDKPHRPVYCDGPASDCRLCKFAVDLIASDSSADRKRGDDAVAKRKFYFNVLDRSPAGKQWHAANKKTKVLSQNVKGNNVGTMVLQEMGAVCKMRKAQGQPNDPNGFDMFLSKTGKQLTTKYKAQFSGNTEPLTAEELAYELIDLKALSAITEADYIAKVINYYRTGAPVSDDGAADFNPAQYERQAQHAQAQHHGQTLTAPPQQQVTTLPPPPPQQASAAKEPPALDLTAGDVEYADTKVVDPFNKETHVRLPCSSCQAPMQMTKGELRLIKCHNCGTIFKSPWAKKA